MSPAEIPLGCRAAVCQNKGKDFTLELQEDFPVPQPGEGQLLLKLSATGLCSSDYHFMKDDWGLPTDPKVNIVGHEVALGEGVDPEEWKVGDRAGVKPYYSVCGKCKACRRGMECHCPKGIAYGALMNGAYSQYCLTLAEYTTRIPDGLKDEYAAPILCSGATTYAAVKKSGCRAGAWMVIPGCGGGVGSMAVQYARALGIRVIAIDAGDKEELCRKLGAEEFIDFRTCPNIRDEVIRITGDGAEAVIVTGGSKSAYADAHKMLCVGGTMVCIEMPPAGDSIAGGHPNDIILGGITITGSLVAGMKDVNEALDFAARGAVTLSNLTTYGFQEFPGLVKQLGAGQLIGRAVVLFDQ